MPWLERVMERMPIFADAGVIRVVNGASPRTPDHNPLVGPAPGLRNFWLSCGASIGIAQGAGAGKYLAQLMVHGETEINMIRVDPRRFGSYAVDEYNRAKAHQGYKYMYVLHLPGEERPLDDRLALPLYTINSKIRAVSIPKSQVGNARSGFHWTGVRRSTDFIATMFLMLWLLNAGRFANG